MEQHFAKEIENDNLQTVGPEQQFTKNYLERLIAQRVVTHWQTKVVRNHVWHGTTIYTKVGQNDNMQTLQKIKIGTGYLQKVLDIIKSKLINSELTLTVGACFPCFSTEDTFHFCFLSKNFC